MHYSRAGNNTYAHSLFGKVRVAFKEVATQRVVKHDGHLVDKEIETLANYNETLCTVGNNRTDLMYLAHMLKL